MRRFSAGILLFVFFLFIPLVCLALKKEDEKRSWVTFGFSYGFYYFDDEVYEDVFDEESFPCLGLSVGFYPLRNLELSAAGRALYEEGYALGMLTEEESGEEFNIWIFPLQLSLSYRLDFFNEQLLVPFVSAGGDYYAYRENREFGDDVEGGKSGYHAGAGLGILLDRLDPEAAASIKSEYGVRNVFLDIRYERAFVGEDDGLDFTGDNYYAHILFEF